MRRRREDDGDDDPVDSLRRVAIALRLEEAASRGGSREQARGMESFAASSSAFAQAVEEDVVVEFPPSGGGEMHGDVPNSGASVLDGEANSGVLSPAGCASSSLPLYVHPLGRPKLGPESESD